MQTQALQAPNRVGKKERCVVYVCIVSGTIHRHGGRLTLICLMQPLLRMSWPAPVRNLLSGWPMSIHLCEGSWLAIFGAHVPDHLRVDGRIGHLVRCCSCARGRHLRLLLIILPHSPRRWAKSLLQRSRPQQPHCLLQDSSGFFFLDCYCCMD